MKDLNILHFLKTKIAIYGYLKAFKDMDEHTFDIDEAAAFLKIHKTTMGELASSGEIQAAKIGTRWVFLKSDLVEHLRKQIAAQTLARRRTAEAMSPKEPVKSIIMKMVEQPKRQRRNKLPDLSAYAA